MIEDFNSNEQLPWNSKGINISKKRIDHLIFVDYLLIIARGVDELIEMFKELCDKVE